MAALSGMPNRWALSEPSANHRALSSFKHCKPSSDLLVPETYWLLSNVCCWCHLSTIFHSHPSIISALCKSDTKLYVQNNQKFIVGKHSNMVDNCIENSKKRHDVACLKRFLYSSRQVLVWLCLRITLKFRNKFLAKSISIWIFSKWLVDEELAQNSRK